MPVNPAVRNPMTAWMRRTVPMACGPHIVAPIVALVAVNPYIASVWRIAADFDYRRRWTNANRNLRKRSRRSQNES
jgi:hypothetical protein